MNQTATSPSLEQYALFDTPIGPCGVAWSDRGLTRLQLPEADRDATEQRLRVSAAPCHSDDLPSEVLKVMADVCRYLSGERVDFSSVALDLADHSWFYQAVYHAARGIGWGRTTSYGILAGRAGAPGAARVVGQVLSQNPIAIIVPCHRVLTSGNKIGGFSAFGGTPLKQRLLALEGVELAPQPALAFEEAP